MTRLRPALFQAPASPLDQGFARGGEPAVPVGGLISLIIPARNEAANLPRLLASLISIEKACGLEGYRIEILLVDDQSQDETVSVVREFQACHPELSLEIVIGQTKPDDWTGKNWACHQGFRRSRGELLVFTDADTDHLAEGWRHCLRRVSREGIDMLSAVPYHRCETMWERYLGVYQILIILSTAAFSRPRPRRLFAIGQFLLFRRSSYIAQRGHEAIRTTLADDLELARLCLKRGGNYAVEASCPVFRVRMYDTFGAFVQGWRRIFRLGFYHSSFTAVVEIYFLIALLTANMRFASAPVFSQVAAVLAMGIFWRVQRRYGDFANAGAFLWIWSVILFVGVSILAVSDLIFARRFVWRDREYLTSGEG